MAPVVHSEHIRYSTASAISSGVPILPKACMEAILSNRFFAVSSSKIPALWFISEYTPPGTTQLTLIFSFPSSAARTFVSVSRAPFVAAYGEAPGNALLL